jgi:hypothetical protein
MTGTVKIRNETLQLLRRKMEGGNIIHVPELSSNAAGMFQLASGAVVYIDGNHRYEAVKEDILLYGPKVVTGGCICGHDYNNPDVELNGEKQAVDEIFGEPDLAFVDTSWPVFNGNGNTQFRKSENAC